MSESDKSGKPELTAEDRERYYKWFKNFSQHADPESIGVDEAMDAIFEYATLHERAAAQARIEQLQKHLNETDDALHVSINLRKYDVKKLDEAHDKNRDLIRENALMSADRDAWKDRYGKLVVEARHADEGEIKGLRYAVEQQTLQVKEYTRLYREYKDRYEFTLSRSNALEEWLTEYRDQLKKENVYHKNTGIINAINHILLDERMDVIKRTNA